MARKPQPPKPVEVFTHGEVLRDPDRFARVRVALGAVRWPNGTALAPAAIYDAIRRDGRRVLQAP